MPDPATRRVCCAKAPTAPWSIDAFIGVFIDEAIDVDTDDLHERREHS